MAIIGFIKNFFSKGVSNMNTEREKLGSRLGFILLSAGCAIGCGNVWKFPWMTGQFGGGGFVLVYILCLIFLGLPAMVMEFAMAAPLRPARFACIRNWKSPARNGTFTVILP